jgi:hypothetical protein
VSVRNVGVSHGVDGMGVRKRQVWECAMVKVPWLRIC